LFSKTTRDPSDLIYRKVLSRNLIVQCTLPCFVKAGVVRGPIGIGVWFLIPTSSFPSSSHGGKTIDISTDRPTDDRTLCRTCNATTGSASDRNGTSDRTSRCAPSAAAGPAN